MNHINHRNHRNHINHQTQWRMIQANSSRTITALFSCWRTRGFPAWQTAPGSYQGWAVLQSIFVRQPARFLCDMLTRYHDFFKKTIHQMFWLHFFLWTNMIMESWKPVPPGEWNKSSRNWSPGIPGWWWWWSMASAMVSTVPAIAPNGVFWGWQTRQALLTLLGYYWDKYGDVVFDTGIYMMIYGDGDVVRILAGSDSPKANMLKTFHKASSTYW